jgi:hypothetical protein
MTPVRPTAISDLSAACSAKGDVFALTTMTAAGYPDHPEQRDVLAVTAPRLTGATDARASEA